MTAKENHAPLVIKKIVSE